jgi:hypothetical protein
MEWFKIRWGMFWRILFKCWCRSENLVHVTCSGYSSPSVAQQAAISRVANYPSYTFYQMGVMGFFRLFVRQVVW